MGTEGLFRIIGPVCLVPGSERGFILKKYFGRWVSDKK